MVVAVVGAIYQALTEIKNNFVPLVDARISSGQWSSDAEVRLCPLNAYCRQRCRINHWNTNLSVTQSLGV